MTRPSPLSPRPAVLDTAAASHGALDFRELERLGIDPDEVLDFSVNSNPYGPSPAVQAAMAEVPLERYPDRDSLALRRALAEQLSVSPEEIVVGNGTAELLWLLAFALLQPGDSAVVVGPTFGEYGRCASLMGAHIVNVSAQAEDNFALEPAQVARALGPLRPRLAFICNPNNPTGSILHPATIGALADAHPHTLFAVDEAYLNFVVGLPSALSLARPNVLVLRSMTKEYAIAGLRLGYAAGPAPLIQALARVRPAWNVNSVAQAAGLVALQDNAHLQASLTSLATAKQALLAGLESLGLAPLPSQTHYFLVDVADGAAFRRALLAHKIQVRDCASFGLPAYVRIATRLPEENARLLAAVEMVLR